MPQEITEELAAYERAWTETPKDERNALCQRLADEYVLAHPELEARWGALTIPELVALVTVAREAGDEGRRIELDVWLMAGFESQQIGGVGQVGGQRRIHPAPPAINVEGDRRTPNKEG